MTYVGMMCNVDLEGDPRERLSPSAFNRTYLVDELLEPAGIRVFLYSPMDVTSAGEADGFVLEEKNLVAVRRPVPRVNANCSFRTRHLLRQGMGYRRFKRWLHERGVEVYAPYEFAELVANKQKTYEVVREWDESLHPHTEEFDASPGQIGAFLERSPSVFIKPRAGHKGNRIFVLRRSGRGYALEYYDNRELRTFPCLSLEATLAVVEVAASREHYVVQEGVESLRCEGCVFDVRVVMAHDGRGWHSIFETRIASPGRAISNVYQGGSNRVTPEALAATVGEREGQAVESRLNALSHGLARHLEARFPGALPEIGFDFVLDQDHEPHLVEVNAKPGIAGIGADRKLFEWTPEELPLHDVWTRPHMRHLAGFLRHKVEASDPLLNTLGSPA